MKEAFSKIREIAFQPAGRRTQEEHPFCLSGGVVSEAVKGQARSLEGGHFIIEAK